MTGRQSARWHLVSEMAPSRGVRFMVLYADGSGGAVFYRQPLGTVRDSHGIDVLGGFARTEALQDWLLEAGFIFWLPLPDGVRLFFEQGAV